VRIEEDQTERKRGWKRPKKKETLKDRKSQRTHFFRAGSDLMKLRAFICKALQDSSLRSMKMICRLKSDKQLFFPLNNVTLCIKQCIVAVTQGTRSHNLFDFYPAQAKVS